MGILAAMCILVAVGVLVAVYWRRLVGCVRSVGREHASMAVEYIFIELGKQLANEVKMSGKSHQGQGQS